MKYILILLLSGCVTVHDTTVVIVDIDVTVTPIKLIDKG